MSEGKQIVLGVTGSIAAFKAAELTSQLTKQNYDVHVVMTADALRFITPLAFKTLSRHPVVTDLYDEEEGWKPTHIQLADEANLLLVAPATANTLAKLANGIADDALTCIALALNPQSQSADRSRHERQDVAARGHATKCGDAQVARCGVYRAGGRVALLRLRRVGDDFGRWRKLPPGCWNFCPDKINRSAARLPMKFIQWQWPKKLAALLEIPAPAPSQQTSRIVAMQRNIVLPARAMVTGVVLYYLFYSRWLAEAATTQGVVLETLQNFFVFYVLFQAGAASILMIVKRYRLGLIQWLVFTVGLLDGLLYAGLMLLTGGFASILFWVFPA